VCLSSQVCGRRGWENGDPGQPRQKLRTLPEK
jgi:hypothetical protein